MGPLDAIGSAAVLFGVLATLAVLGALILQLRMMARAAREEDEVDLSAATDDRASSDGSGDGDAGAGANATDDTARRAAPRARRDRGPGRP